MNLVHHHLSLLYSINHALLFLHIHLGYTFSCFENKLWKYPISSYFNSLDMIQSVTQTPSLRNRMVMEISLGNLLSQFANVPGKQCHLEILVASICFLQLNYCGYIYVSVTPSSPGDGEWEASIDWMYGVQLYQYKWKLPALCSMCCY